MRNLISAAKDGTYEIKIPIPGRPVSHVLPHRFSTEERAYDWLQSPEGVSTVTRIREKYKKLNAKHKAKMTITCQAWRRR